MDFRRETSSKKNSGGDQSLNVEAQPKPDHAQPLTPKGKFVEGRNFTRDRKEMKCYLCDGPHWIRDCPKKKAFNAMMLKEEEEEEKEAHMSSMRCLNSFSKDEGRKESGTRGRGLLFVEAKVNEGVTKALVDTGATHSFIAEEEAKKLGIHYKKEPGWLKVVNSPSSPIVGVSYEVPMKIADWEGTNDLVVVPMDDYRMVLGMDFLDKVRPWSFEKDNTMRITRGSMIHIVPLERSNAKSRAIATMKFIEGSSKKEATWRTTVMETKPSIPYRKNPFNHKHLVESSTQEKSSTYGSSVTKKSCICRDLDEDVKGLSGGGCHGPRFWSKSRLSDKPWIDQEYQRKFRRRPGSPTRPWNTLEKRGGPRNNMERPRSPGEMLEYPGRRWEYLELPGKY